MNEEAEPKLERTWTSPPGSCCQCPKPSWNEFTGTGLLRCTKCAGFEDADWLERLNVWRIERGQEPL